MILVTGGAGFIGSNVVAALNDAGFTDVVVNDTRGSDQKWRNLRKRRIADFVAPQDLALWLKGRKLDAIIQLGAVTATTATDGDAVIEANFRLSLEFLDWCSEARVPFIYASSVATYGDRTSDFDDDWSSAELNRLRPMNLYGWSKHLFDELVVDRFEKSKMLPLQWAGLKFFNVFDPNEYHTGAMASVVSKVFDQAKPGKPVRLFKSHRDGIADVDQRRDFVYVDGIVAVILWFVKMPNSRGIYNVGTGHAGSFREMITAMFEALGRPPNIEYVDMPEAICDSYQYFTQSEVKNLRRAGYNADFTPVPEAVRSYVLGYLNRPGSISVKSARL
jgi:ADP-L-glycero-D-manno-heptose 6-epimerase